MQELKIFESAEFGEVRTVEIDGKPYFAGKDVARALGYADTVNALKTHCREDGVAFYHLTDSLGRAQEAKFINEGNLYRLIVSSKLPSAERFECWVFDEVLPTIRRHGLYAIDDIIADPDLGIRALLALKAEREARKALEVDNKIKDQQIAELKPKASYYDLILQCSGLLSVTEIAKDYGLSAKALNKMLHDLGVQFSQSVRCVVPLLEIPELRLHTDQDAELRKTRRHTGSAGSYVLDTKRPAFPVRPLKAERRAADDRENGGGMKLDIERVRADVERLNSLVSELRLYQAWADTGLRDLEAGKPGTSAMILAAMHISQAVRACKEFSDYFEKKVGMSLSEEKEVQHE